MNIPPASSGFILDPFDCPTSLKVHLPLTWLIPYHSPTSEGKKPPSGHLVLFFFGLCLKQRLFWSFLEKTLLPSNNVLAPNDQELPGWKETNKTVAGDRDARADQLETSGLTWCLDGLWALKLQPFVPCDCDSDIKENDQNYPKLGYG